ncbi:MAG: hypothetical protein K0S33_3405 [Bacteroidetes bacterium]|jgi:hypothetical protein|nr:hypothetical protein [Bacteroidota bacterium]
MSHLDWGSILTVLISCAIKPGLAGIPAAVFVFNFSFLETLIVCSSGSLIGVFVFTYLIEGILKLVNRVLDKRFPNRNRNKKNFTWKNRFIIKAKRNFGIIGVSAITPVFLSYPLGIFLAIRFFGDHRKTLIWMSVSSVAWTVVLYFIFHFFHASLQRFFD